MSEYPIPRSIVADGVTPQGPLIAAWIASIPSGTVNDPAIIRFAPYASYCTDAVVNGARTAYPIEIKGTSRFELRGQGSRLVRRDPAGKRTDSILRLVHCNQFAVKHLRLAGCAPTSAGYEAALEAQHGLELNSCHNGLFVDVHADDVWGDKTYWSAASPGDSWCDTLEFDGCGGTRSHRHSVGIVGASNVYSHDCDWGRCDRTGVDAEPPGTQGGASNIRFAGDTWGTHRNNWFAAGIPHGNVDGITFTSCRSLGSPLSIAVFNSGTATLGAFTVEYCATQAAAPGTDAGAAMKFSGVTGPIRVVGNHQPIDPSRRVSGLPMRIARFNDCTGPIEYHDNTPPDPGT